jgi:hypothetical protein
MSTNREKWTKNSMNRRSLLKGAVALGLAACAGEGMAEEQQDKVKAAPAPAKPEPAGDSYEEPAKRLPARRFDVVVAGGGTAGVMAAIAAARQGAKTVLIESKGYTGGIITEGGTALHSFFNVWKPYPGVKKTQLVKGIPHEIIERLTRMGGTSGHAELSKGYAHDSVCLAVDVELYKLLSHTMLHEAGVYVCLNTLLAGVITEGKRIKGVIAESRSGREAFFASAFIDCTGYGDLAAHAGAGYSEPNDFPLCNSMGVANVDVESLCKNLQLIQYAEGLRSGKEGKIVRFKGGNKDFDLRLATTTVHDNYLMFVKADVGGDWGTSKTWRVTDRDEMAKYELEARKLQQELIAKIRKVPGCETAFSARSSPVLNIRRGRVIKCDYDISASDVLGGRHFDDDVMAYGFQDQEKPIGGGGGSFGIPYRALCAAEIENLLVAGMMITSAFVAHHSTRNTVSCMAQGQAVGTAAALCAAKTCMTRDLKYPELKKALLDGGVYLKS